MSRRTRILVVVAGAVAMVGVAALVAWRVVLRDTAEPASIDEALSRYRAEAAAGETPIPAGVYVYATTGFESISALGGTRHRYPPRSTITVTSVPCGMQLRWDVLRTRSNTSTICAVDEGGVPLRLDGWSESHVFFGQKDRTVWKCSASPWLTEPAAVGTRASHSCDGGDATQTGTVNVVAQEAIPVGGATVETLHLRLGAREVGASRGPLVEDRWVELETGLPVRIRYRVRTENDSPIGDVTFEERYELRLTSLEPRR